MHVLFCLPDLEGLGVQRLVASLAQAWPRAEAALSICVHHRRGRLLSGSYNPSNNFAHWDDRTFVGLYSRENSSGGSFNLHESFFGKTFDITADGLVTA